MARTNRPLLRRVWAEDASEVLGGGVGGIADPDADTTHPGGTGGAGKFARGWEYRDQISTNAPEKFPEQWYNFWANQVDSALRSIAQAGVLPWQSTVTYKVGAITSEGGVLYTATQSSTGAPTGGAEWAETLADTLSTGANYLNTFVGGVATHREDKNNPHAVSASTFFGGVGYTATMLEQLYRLASSTIEAHQNDTSNPHGASYTQLGMLGVGGGVFLGVVGFEAMSFGGGVADLIANTSGSTLYQASTLSSITIEADGLFLKDFGGKAKQKIAHAENFSAVRATSEPRWSTPTPDWVLPLSGGLDTLSVGAYSCEYTRATAQTYTDKYGTSQVAAVDTPAFETLGLLRGAGDSLVLEGVDIPVAGMDVTIAWFGDNGLPYVSLLVVPVDTNVLTYISNAASHVRHIRIWAGFFTTQQMTSLGEIV